MNDFSGEIAPPLSADDGDDESFLRGLGERLRLIRAQRAMPRRLLARQSGVSERYIAQFEAGAGNMSLLLLRRLARALGVPTQDLLSLGQADRPQDVVLLERFVARLSGPQIREARRVLLDRFGGGVGARRERIALVGLRGAGKSSLGRLLAERRGVPFVELDREVERLSRMELRDIFEVHGQDGFRRQEREALRHVVATEPRVVIATGGGLVADPTTFELLLANCLTVWIKASPEEHMRRVVAQGDQRPMAEDQRRAMDDLRAILASREKLYNQADLVLDSTGRTLRACLAELAELTEVRDD
jgi:XRE family aerobic/anaerobic benzoate catabolism transcriptional regulator